MNNSEKHPDAVTYTNDEVIEKEHASHNKKSKTNNFLLAILKSFSVSKNIIILILSGIFVSLVIANFVVFVLPRSSAVTTTLVPTPIPTIQLLPSISKAVSLTPTSIQTPSPTKKATPTSTPTRAPSATPTPTQRPTANPTTQPTATPTPKPPTFTDMTYGQLESANCSAITGWAYNPASPNDEVNVWLYADGGTYGGIMSGNLNTTILRADINASKNITGNHGFSFTVIAPLKDGKEHSLYVYADINGVRNQIGNTPLYLTCN